ncbi:MAG: hypothetical protein ACOY0T_31110 [Myxococcota bacterium]
MMKFLVPLAIGAGLVLLMTSSSKAAPTTTQAGPYDALPLPMRQLVVQAHATQDPGMFEVVAAQLELQGYAAQARLMRSQAEQLRSSGRQAVPVATANT